HIMACWYTNLDLQKRHDGLWHIGDKFDQTKAHKYYKGFEEKYPKYDNYNGINIDNLCLPHD
ncbi:Type II restriction enzyme, modification methylase, partial [human gut metagenome]